MGHAGHSKVGCPFVDLALHVAHCGRNIPVWDDPKEEKRHPV